MPNCSQFPIPPQSVQLKDCNKCSLFYGSLHFKVFKCQFNSAMRLCKYNLNTSTIKVEKHGKCRDKYACGSCFWLMALCRCKPYCQRFEGIYCLQQEVLHLICQMINETEQTFKQISFDMRRREINKAYFLATFHELLLGRQKEAVPTDQQNCTLCIDWCSCNSRGCRILTST